VLRAYLRQLAAELRRWEASDGRDGGLGAAYRQLCATIGRRVEVLLPGRPAVLGSCHGVDEDGRLLVRDDAGREHAFAAGDVTHARSS
jgi:BirA family biotin operon repressor/biotin-[acetyl-CoA-carboxylase] ligase